MHLNVVGETVIKRELQTIGTETDRLPSVCCFELECIYYALTIDKNHDDLVAGEV